MQRGRILPPLGLMAAVVAGCMVGPAYHEPKAQAPGHFGELAHPGSAGGGGFASEAPPDPGTLERWWTVFHDPELESLVARALKDNRDLKVAVSRVRQARAERQEAAGSLLPEAAATAGYNRALGSRNVQLPLSALGGGSPSGSSGKASGSAPGATLRTQDVAAGSAGGPAAVPPGGPQSPFGEGGLPGVTTNLYQAGFDAVWEIDVFGGTRRAVQAADAQAAAAQEGEYGVRVTLLAEVATTYMQLRSIQEREEIARRTIGSQRTTWRIAQDRFEAGMGSEVEAAQERAQLKEAETALPPLAAAERTSQHALAFMLGEEPTALSAELSPRGALPVLPDGVPVGVPSDLLRRRPDIRQAERQLAAASAQIGAATAQLYPQFSITGLLGLDSSDLRHLPEWSSRYYSVAPGVSWPILDWTRLRAAVRVADEQQAQALLAYQTAVLRALRDVEDALVQYGRERERHAGLAEAAALAREARRVTAQVYEHGLADQTATLQAERAVNQAEDSLAQSGASLRTDLVGLYKALGGGWDPADPTNARGVGP
jgi:multidrug efflux system outer membrane protein